MKIFKFILPISLLMILICSFLRNSDTFWIGVIFLIAFLIISILHMVDMYIFNKEYKKDLSFLNKNMQNK